MPVMKYVLQNWLENTRVFPKSTFFTKEGEGQIKLPFLQTYRPYVVCTYIPLEKELGGWSQKNVNFC